MNELVTQFITQCFFNIFIIIARYGAKGQVTVAMEASQVFRRPLPGARTLTLPHLCACCFSDVHTRNVHVSGIDMKELSHSYVFFLCNWMDESITCQCSHSVFYVLSIYNTLLLQYNKKIK